MANADLQNCNSFCLAKAKKKKNLSEICDLHYWLVFGIRQNVDVRADFLYV
jgi:glutathione peroxidase-family protein